MGWDGKLIKAQRDCARNDDVARLNALATAMLQGSERLRRQCHRSRNDNGRKAWRD